VINDDRGAFELMPTEGSYTCSHLLRLSTFDFRLSTFDLPLTWKNVFILLCESVGLERHHYSASVNRLGSHLLFCFGVFSAASFGILTRPHFSFFILLRSRHRHVNFHSASDSMRDFSIKKEKRKIRVKELRQTLATLSALLLVDRMGPRPTHTPRPTPLFNASPTKIIG